MNQIRMSQYLIFGKEMSLEFINKKLNSDPKNSLADSRKKITKFSDLKQTRCFICGSKRGKKDSNIFGINYLTCRKCSHAYVDKRLSDKAISKYYTEDNNYSSVTYANKKSMKIREEIVKPKIKFFKKFVNGKNWLDIGAADGSSISICKKEGFSTEGTELSETSRKFAKKYRNIDLYPKSLEDFNNEFSRKWNVISFFGVLEHIPEPMKILKLCNKMMKKNGIIAIDVPNYNSISTYVQKLAKNPNRHLIPSSHIMLFTIKSLEFALKKNGFKPIAVWMWGMDMIEFLKYINNLDKDFLTSKLGKFLISKTNEFQKIFDQEKLGDDFLMVAKKL